MSITSFSSGITQRNKGVGSIPFFYSSKMKWILLFFYFVSNVVFSQLLVSGSVVSSNGGPLPFCSIGIEGQDIGTVSNFNGHFQLQIPESIAKDSITFSYVGYKESRIAISLLLEGEDNVIVLEENVAVLDEVLVQGKKGKQVAFGYKKDTEIFHWMGGQGQGAEVATYIPLKKEVYLDEISVQLENPGGQEFQLLLSLYEVDSATGKPGSQFLKERTLITSSLEKGWLKVDISKQNILIDKPFFVSYKWIDVSKETPLLGMIFTTDKAFFRTVALGEWKVYINANIKVTGTIIR